MENIKKISFISIVIICILFSFLVYPGNKMLNEYPNFIKYIFNFFAFVGVASFIIYLVIEIKNLNAVKKKDEISILKENKEQIEDHVDRMSLKMRIDPSKNYKQMTQQLLKIIRSSLFGETSFIYLYNRTQKYFKLQQTDSTSDISIRDLIHCDDTWFGKYVENPEPLIISPEDIEKVSQEYYEKSTKVGSILIAPIVFGEFIGLLGVDGKDKKAWRDDDLELLKDFSTNFTQFVWQLDSIEQQEKHIKFFQELYKINRDMTLVNDYFSLYKIFANLIKQYFEFDKITIAITEKLDSTDLQIEYVEGIETDYSIGDKVLLPDGLFNEILINKEILIDKYDESEFKYRFHPKDKSMLPFKSCIGVSLNINNQLNGGLLLESYKTYNYDNDNLLLLSLIGFNLSKLLKRLKDYKEVKELSMIDGLTELYNQKAFKEMLQKEIERCRRYDTRLTFLMLDLDKFKKVNDSHGHLFGDFVLQKVSQIIRTSVRSIDIVSRYGGEEFGVILINSDIESCYKTAERIRSNIENFLFENDNISVKLTISIGISEYPQNGDDYHEIISCADKAMYQSKKLQGNKVSIYKPEQ